MTIYWSSPAATMAIVRHWTGTQAEPAAQTFDAGQPITAMCYRPKGICTRSEPESGSRCGFATQRANLRDRPPSRACVGRRVFTPNGQQVSVASGALIQILDADNGREIEPVDRFGSRVLSMAYTPDGEMLFTAAPTAN